MRTFSQRSDKFVFSVTIMILFASTIWIPSASALPQQQQTSFDVKITDPAEGNQVAIGKNLTLSGTSNYNPTSNCGVFIIVDGIKPYQKTTPIGQAGGNDYSKWKYTLTPAYAGTIEEGNNRVTAKLVCQANPASLTTFHSIYVTGMNVPKHSAITPNNATVVHVSSSTSSNLLHPRPLINHLSATMHSTMNVPKHSAITPNNATVVHVSSSTSSNLLHPRPHSTGDSSDSNRHNYHNISTSTYSGSSSSGDSSSASSRHHYHNICAYTGSSSSGDSSSASSRHHYHNICAYIHHPDHGKSSGYPVRYDVGSFGGGPGGSFGVGPGYYP
jgi:hypothetical protein